MRVVLGAGALALAGVAAVAALVLHVMPEAGVAVTPARILAGDCHGCSHNEVRVLDDGTVLDRWTGSRLVLAVSRRGVDGLDPHVGMAEFDRGRLLQVVAFPPWGGEPVRVDQGAIDAYNRCRAEPVPADCGGRARFPLDLSALSPLSTLVVQGEVHRGWRYDDGSQGWWRPDGSRLTARHYGADLYADVPLQVDGDLEPGDTPGHWRYAERDAGWMAASTGTDWARLAAAVQLTYHRIAGEGAEALDAIPRDGSGDPERVLRTHWAWLRANLRYEVNDGLLGGVQAPSPVATLLERRTGDCKDFTLLMHALLAREGIASEVVLVDARAPFDAPQTAFPVPRITHVMLWLPEQRRFIDPTLAPTRALPMGWPGDLALVVHADGRYGPVRAAEMR